MNTEVSNAAQSGTLYTSLFPSPSFDSFIEEESSRSQRHEIEGVGRYLSLIYEEQTSSFGLVSQLAVEAWPSNRHKKPSKAFRIAVGNLLANLLYINGSGTYSYGYHLMNPKGFLLLRVSYKPFVAAVRGLEANGYIAVKKGWKEHSGSRAKGQATRFQATAKLIDAAAEHGITPANWKEHFPRLPRPAAIPNSIVLKADSTSEGKGRRMNVERDDPAVVPLATVVNDINAFMQKQDIQPDKHYAFARFFARGDHPATFWNKGARLYSIGPDNYQQDNGVTRRAMTINGQAVVELDIRASHLTILHALSGVPQRNNPDPYLIVGFERDAVKTFVTMTLGHVEFHRDWTQDAVVGYAKRRKKNNLPALALPPYDELKAAVLEAIPLLQSWPESSIRWGDLQFRESEAIVEAVHTLAMVHELTALPVHDSLIVPASAAKLSRQVLEEAFYKHVGVCPFIDIKGQSPS